MKSVSVAEEWFTVRWMNGRLLIMDQRQLPQAESYVVLETLEDVFEAIRTLMVRGAPAIGIVAAWGMALAANQSVAGDTQKLLEELKLARDYVASARPTAVNLSWAVNRMMAKAERSAKDDRATIVLLKNVLIQEAALIQREDEGASRAMGEHLLSLLDKSYGILTHCNAGQLATSRYGTALSPIYVGIEKGKKFHVFVDETRPVLQGSRLTAWELQKLGVDVTLICDNMAAAVMSQHKVDAVIVGADRVAGNGDVANKIGTLGVALLAHHYEIPFYVAAPLSTVDLAVSDGRQIPIEQRSSDEIVKGFGVATAPEGISVYNPAFDVTPHAYISAIVTERGVARRPYSVSLREQMREVNP